MMRLAIVLDVTFERGYKLPDEVDEDAEERNLEAIGRAAALNVRGELERNEAIASVFPVRIDVDGRPILL